MNAHVGAAFFERTQILVENCRDIIHKMNIERMRDDGNDVSVFVTRL
jgi:hypothetical protein